MESEDKTSAEVADFESDKERFQTMHPSDIAAELEDLELDVVRDHLRDFSDETAADVIIELPQDMQTELMENMRLDRVSDIIPEMNSDDAADALGHVSPARLSEILDELPAEDGQEISGLLEYDEDTAGGIMQKELLAINEDLSLHEAREAIRKDEDQEGDSSIYVYVVDADKKLKGVLRLRDLLFRDLRLKVKDVMITEVRSVSVEADQEEIAQLFQKYNFTALPVVDVLGRLTGLVTSDDVIDVIQEEATEDMQRMVGMSGEEMVSTPWFKSVRNRLPWLCINLCTAFAVAWVVSRYEHTISQYAVLAVFLPIIGLLGGNVGSQTLTIVVRSLALGEIEDKEWRGVLAKELIVGFTIGITIGCIVGFISFIWKGSSILGIVAFLACMLNMTAATMAGVLVPISLRALKIDPALASSIMVTTVTDIIGFLLFLSLASLAISLFGI